MASLANISDKSQIGSTKGVATMAIVAVVLIIVIVFFNKIMKGVDGFFESIGLKDSKAEKQDNQTIDKTVNNEINKGITSGWSPSFYKNAPGGSMLLTSAQGNKLAETLWSSVGYLYDSPNIGAGVIKQMKTKSQLSFLMDCFFKKYGVDGLTWLKNKYDTSEQKDVLADMLTFAKKLPDYNV